ncbi:MAG: hypothetical protein R3E12_05205 [Candidatus Eisenbacteria bacterium]
MRFSTAIRRSSFLHHSNLLRSVAGSLALLLSAASISSAEVSPFVTLGGSTIHTVREDFDLFFNPIEIEHWKQGWEAGAGLSVTTPGDAPRLLHPQWEARIRLSRVAGKLAGITSDFARTQAPFYSAHFEETFEYSGWMLSPAAVMSVHPMLGVYCAPTIQRLKLKGHEIQDWEGDIPIFFPVEDSEGTANGTVINGLIEVGARVHPLQQFPAAALELFWVPKRVQMSSTQESNESGYVANFARLYASVGARLTYDF